MLGTLDLSTGVFTVTAELSQEIYSLAAAGGTLYAGSADGHIYTVGSGGALTQFGTVTSDIGFWGLAYAGSNGFYAVNPGFEQYRSTGSPRTETV